MSSGCPDYVSIHNSGDPSPNEKSGCSLLFIEHLYTQLGFDTKSVVAAGASELAGVYNNLTGDTSNLFLFFKSFLESRWPGTSTISAPDDADNPFLLALMSFTARKNTFGKDEVLDQLNTSGGKFQDVLEVDVEGFNQLVLGSILPSLSGVALGFPGIYLDLDASGITLQSTNPKVPQKVTFLYTVWFTINPLTGFPTTCSDLHELDVSITVSRKTFTIAILFEFFVGANPYFANVLQQNSVFYLSQDLRVFTVTLLLTPNPINAPGALLFAAANNNVNGAAAFFQQLLAWVNSIYSDPTKTDLFTAPTWSRWHAYRRLVGDTVYISTVCKV